MPVSLHGGESSLPRSWAVELPQQVDHYPGPSSGAPLHQQSEHRSEAEARRSINRASTEAKRRRAAPSTERAPKRTGGAPLHQQSEHRSEAEARRSINRASTEAKRRRVAPSTERAPKRSGGA